MINLIGNKKVREYFEKIIAEKKFGHAYLFYGPEGVGKKEFAFKIARDLLVNQEDMYVLDKNEPLYISEVRELKNFFRLTPQSSEYKVAILNNAHLISGEASHALLKILEEPPKNSLIFLITSLPSLVLATIKSRCEEIKFSPIKKQEIRDFLKTKNINEKEAEQISELCQGSVSQALSFAQNGLKEYNSHIEIFKKLQKSDIASRFNFAKQIMEDIDETKKILRNWILFLKKEKIESPGILKIALRTDYLLSQAQYNHKLIFENFMLCF